MGSDIEDFGSEILVPEILSKHKIEMESNYDIKICCVELKSWAYNFNKRNIKHAYEDIWGEGWIVLLDVNGKEHKFNWWLKDNSTLKITKSKGNKW